MPQRRQYPCGDARRELPPCPPHLSCKLRPQCAEGTPGRPLHWVRTVQPALPARYRHSGGTAPHRWLCGTVEARHIMSRKMLNRPACCTDWDVRAYCGTEGKSALTGNAVWPTFTTCCLHNCNGSAGIVCRQVVKRGAAAPWCRAERERHMPTRRANRLACRSAKWPLRYIMGNWYPPIRNHAVDG